MIMYILMQVCIVSKHDKWTMYSSIPLDYYATVKSCASGHPVGKYPASLNAKCHFECTEKELK